MFPRYRSLSIVLLCTAVGLCIAARAGAQCTWDSTSLNLTTDCRVGIATTNPTSPLHVTGAIRADRLIDDSGTSWVLNPSHLSFLNLVRVSRIHDRQRPQYFLDPAATDRSLVVAGKIGIGTIQPDETLHVEGKGRFGEGGNFIKVGHNTADANLDNFGTGKLLINWYGSGDVSIGTRPGNEKSLKVGKDLTVGSRIFIEGSDLVLGTADGRDIGNRPKQRALVHGGVSVGAKREDSLVINYGGDFEGGVQIVGQVVLGGQHIATGPHTDYRLSVDGKVVTRELIVTDGIEWADYVFEEGYELLPLPDLERFIAREGHLPNIPSAADVERDGIDIAEVSAQLLAKVEELTLHLIAQDKALAEQRATITEQELRIDRLLSTLATDGEMSGK